MTNQHKAKQHIQNWMDENNVTMRELSLMAGKSRGYIKDMLNRGGVSYKPYVVLDPIVHFPEEIMEGLKDEWDWYYQHKHMKPRKTKLTRTDLFNQALQAWGRVA